MVTSVFVVDGTPPSKIGANCRAESQLGRCLYVPKPRGRRRPGLVKGDVCRNRVAAMARGADHLRVFSFRTALSLPPTFNIIFCCQRHISCGGPMPLTGLIGTMSSFTT